MTTQIEARDSATLEWLPQETIVFEGGGSARNRNPLRRNRARLAMDWLLFGRTASGEVLRTGAIRDSWRVHRDGKLIWADSFRLEGDIAGQIARASLLGGHTAIATILYAAADAGDHLDRARELLAKASARLAQPSSTG